MKKIVVLMLALASSVASADYRPGSLDFTCRSVGETNGRYPLKVELTQLTDTSFEEEERVPFQISISEIRPIGQEVKVIPTVRKGTLFTSDVQVLFRSSDRTINFGLYMDEEGQEWLQFKGGKNIRLRCEPPKRQKLR